MKPIAAAVAFLTIAIPALASDISKYTDEPCSVLPPIEARQKPNVPYSIMYALSDGELQFVCGPSRHHLLACAVPPNNDDANWMIVLPRGLSKQDAACLLMYERAHLPPNNWYDPDWERHLYGPNALKPQT